VGDKVKVTAKGVMMKHLPKFKAGLDVSGLEGEVLDLIFFSKDGVEVSTNRPVLISFPDPNFRAHFEFEEIEKTAV
jgi:hypothetical protein